MNLPEELLKKIDDLAHEYSHESDSLQMRYWAHNLIQVIAFKKGFYAALKLENESNLLRLLADKQDQIIKLRKEIENLEYEIKDWERYSKEN